MDRAGVRPGRLFDRPGRQAVQPGGVETGGRRTGSMAGADIGGEHGGLLDGLVGAATMQFRRTVGGEQQHRHAGQARLDHRRQPVGRRRAGGGEQHRRLAAGARQAKREKRGRTLVDRDMAGQPVLAEQSQRQRRRAGAGGDDGVAHTGRLQAGDQGLDQIEVQRGGIVHGRRCGARGRCSGQR